MKQNIKDKILEKASYLFHTQGYNSTGINQIIEESGVAKASLYNHYKSKEELAIAYLTNRHTYWMNELKKYVGKGKTNKDKLLLAFDFIDYMNEKENYQGCCFLNMLSEIRPTDKAIREVIVNHKKDVQFFIGSLVDSKNSNLQGHIYILFEGALIETQLYRNQWAVSIAKEVITNTII